MWYRTGGFLLALLVLVPAVQACLTTEQTAALVTITSELNMTAGERAAFYSIFDNLCNRTDIDTIESRLDITDQVANATHQEISNWTEWVEEQIAFTSTLNRYAEIINTSISPEGILNEVDERIERAENNLNDRFRDLNEEVEVKLENAVTRHDLNETVEDLEMQIMIAQSASNRQESGNIFMPVAGSVILFIIGFFAYSKWKMDREEKLELKRLRENPAYREAQETGRVRMSEEQEQMLSERAKRQEQEELERHRKIEEKLQEEYFAEQKEAEAKKPKRRKTQKEKEEAGSKIGEMV